MTTSQKNETDLTNGTSDDSNRDDYYKQIIRNQFGENGITLTTNLTLMFVIIITIVLIGISGVLTSKNEYTKIPKLDVPIITDAMQLQV